jgi:hypothetical protein
VVVTNRRRGTNRFVLAFFDGDCVWQPMERIGPPIYRNYFTINVWKFFSHGTLQALWSAVHGLFPRIVADNVSGVFFGPTIAPIP